ncbi:MAG TPA: IreB family regulatory phosphoprotein [Bacillota bacterium]|nr:IreB family regulatory phosphoprotein [Bacillota bacterium]HPT86584.1 IreB family regulatory phosphoprotein [Bacillota bacterium]
MHMDDTREFATQISSQNEVSAVLRHVCRALRENGYNPLDQIVGYLISGDPTYITNHQNARLMIRQLERDQILDELVHDYLEREGI